MQFSLHLLPLFQLLLSSATVSAVTTSVDSSHSTSELQSSDQGSADLLYPIIAETETDDPTTTAMANAPESTPPNESTTFEEIHTTTTEQYAATSDPSSATVAMPSTESFGTTEESTIEGFQTTTKYGATVQAITKSVTAGSPPESPYTTEASSTTETHQTATPGVSSTITELDPAFTNESPTTSDSQSTAELSPITAFSTVTTVSESELVSTKQPPSTDQFQPSAEYSEFSNVTMSLTVTDRSTTESSTMTTSTESERLSIEEYPNTVETTAEYGAATQSLTIIIDSKSNILVTEEPSAYDLVQFATTMAVFPTTTEPFPSTEDPPAANMFQTTAKDSTATDSSAFIQPFTVLFTQNPLTVNEFLTTAEHTTTTDHFIVTMASNNDQSESPETKAAYSVSTTVTRATLSLGTQYTSTTKPMPSKGSITMAASLQSLSAAESPSMIDHQANLKFSTASYSYSSPIKPTTAKHSSPSASVYSTAIEFKSTPALKPQNVTQLELMTTTEFPITTHFPTTSKRLSIIDFESRTVALSHKIQPTFTQAKTSIRSTTFSSMNSAGVMYPMNVKSEPSTSMEGLHVLVTESLSIPPIQSPTIRGFPTTSNPSSAMLTSDISTPTVPQATTHPSLVTTTPTSSYSLVASKFVELSGYETITKSASTMESMFPVVSTTIPRTSLESLQHHSITESPIPRKTEFSPVAILSTPTNYHPTTTNYYSIFKESYATAESPITREFPSATQYPSKVLSTIANFLSLDVQLTTTTDALQVSSFPTMSELPIATKSLTTSHHYSPPPLLQSKHTSTEYLITSSQAILKFPAVSSDPPSEYTQSPLPTLSPTIVKSEPVTNMKIPTKSTVEAGPLTSLHTTIFPASTKTESQHQSITKISPSLHSPTAIQLSSPIISSTPATVTILSDTTSQSKMLTTKFPTSSNFSVTNTRIFSNARTVELILVTESSKLPPTIQSPNTVLLITSDQPLNIPATTPSTITPSATLIGATSLSALVLTTEAVPTIVMLESASTKVSLSTTTIYSFPVSLESTPTALSVSPSEYPSATESLAITESHPIPTRMIKTFSTSESMVDATVTALRSMISPTQSMLSTNESPKTSVTSQLLEMEATNTATESQIMAVTPSDSATESPTIPTLLSSMIVPEFSGTTTNYLPITESLPTRESLAATESHPAASQMIKISTTSVTYPSLTGTSIVLSPSVKVLPGASTMTPMQSITDTLSSVVLSTSIILATTEAMNPEEILTTTVTQFSMATADAVKSVTETQITQSSALRKIITTNSISTTESHVLTPSPTMGLPVTVESIKIATESLSITPLMSKIISIQSSLTSSLINTEYQDATTITRELITGSLSPSSVMKPPTITEEALATTELQKPTPTPFSLPNVVETAVESTLTNTESQILIDATVIAPSATNIEAGSEMRMLKSTPVAEVGVTTTYDNNMSAAESLTMGDYLVATKSNPIIPEMTKVLSTSMGYPSSGSMFTAAVSPSTTELPSTTRQSLTSMQPTPSATDNPANMVLSTTLNLAIMESRNPEETSATSQLATMATVNETKSMALEATITTKFISTTESHSITPSATLDLPPTMTTSSPTSKANASTFDSVPPTNMPTSLVFEATISDNSSILATPTATESESTVESSHATRVLLLSITELPASDSMLPSATTFSDVFTSPAMESKISSTTITTVESLTATLSRAKSISMQSLFTSPLINKRSTSSGTATESVTIKISPTATEISQRPTATLSASSNVAESVVGSTVINTESQVTAVETTAMTIMATKPLTLSILPSVTLESSDSSIIVPSQLSIEYSSISPTTTSTAAAITLSSKEYSITLSSMIMPSVSVSEPVSETRLLTKASLVVMGSPTVTELQSMVVYTSVTGLESAVKQTTIEPSNAIEPTLIVTGSLNISLLPTSTETLLPITTEQLTPVISTIMTTTDSTRLEGKSPTISELLVSSIGSMNDTIIPSTITVEYSNTRLLSTSGFSSLSYTNFQSTTGHSESHTVTSNIVESTAPIPTAHPSLTHSNSTTASTGETTSLSISQFSIAKSTSQQSLPTSLVSTILASTESQIPEISRPISNTQFAKPTITPSMILKSLTDDSISPTASIEYSIPIASAISIVPTLKVSTTSKPTISVTALRSVTNLELKDTVLTQMVHTTSNPPRFTTMTSSPILKLPLLTITKTRSNTPKQSTTAISVEISTEVFPTTSEPLVATESDIETTIVRKSQASQFPGSVEVTTVVITATKNVATMTSLYPLLETPTIAGPLGTIGHSSTMEYSSRASESPVSVEVTVHSITATKPLTIMPSMSSRFYISTEASASTFSKDGEIPTITESSVNIGPSSKMEYSSQTSESPVALATTTELITATKSPLIMPSRSMEPHIIAETTISPLLESPTIAGPLVTIGRSSTMEYFSERSESPVSVQITSTTTKSLLTVPSRSMGSYVTTKTSISPLLETPTVTGSLGTTEHPSTTEYSSQASESPVSMEITTELIIATEPPVITPSVITMSSITLRESPTITESLLTIRHTSATEYSTQALKSLAASEFVHISTTKIPETTVSISDFVRSSAAIKITNSLEFTPLQTKKSIAASPSTTIESQLPSTTLSPTPVTIQTCSHEVNSSKEGIIFVWPETPVHSNATFKCPKNSAIKLLRECNVGGKWGDFDQRGCGVLAKEFTNLVMESKNLTNNTLEKTADTLSKLVEESLNNQVEQSMENMNEISNAFVNMANYVNTSKAQINESVIGNIVKTLDSLLQWIPSTVLTNTSSRIVESFERVTSQYAQHIPLNATVNFTNPSVSITAENMPAEILQQKGRNLAFGNRGQIIEADTIPGQLSSQQQAAISLPATLFKHVTVPNVGMFFGFYDNATLFPIGGTSTDSSAPRQPQVCSHILAATVGQNIDLRDLNPEESVTLTFRIEDKLPGVYVAPNSEKCVSWDFNTQDWTDRGCNVTKSTEDGIFVCHCNHLTNFAILVDMCQTQEDCQTLTTMAPTTPPAEMQLNQLNNSFTNLTNDTYGEAVMMLADIIGGTENSTANQNSQVLKQVADYFSTLATFVNDSNVTINKTVVNDVVQVVSSLIQWKPENVMVESSSSVVESFEKVIALYAQQLPLNQSAEFMLPSLTLVAESRSVESLTQEGRSFTIGNNQARSGPEGHVKTGQLHPTQDAAVNLPASLFQQIDNRTTIGIFFALYDTPILFPVNGEKSVHSDETDVGSPILSITVGPGLDFQKLEHNITIVLRLIAKNFTTPGSERCVSWDFNHQDWTTQGCTTHVGQDGIVSCSCNHLTNFAVLVDICLRQEDCTPSEVDIPLTFISYIGMSISIVFLVITIVTLFLFKEVRQKDISKYHIQLSLAILLMLVVSVVLVAFSAGGITTVYGGCMTVSVLVHYFTLVSVMWMGAEALLMFQKLVYVFYKITTKFIITVSIVCWTVPSIFVAIPLAVDLATGYDIESDIIVKRANKSDDISFCFLSHVGAFWGAFLGPIFIIMLFNAFIFIRVIIVMVRHTKDTAARLNKPVSNKTIIRLMISIGGVMFLFGLTWLFAVLTFSVTGLRETFQILFVVFNSFQGLFIFLFVCVLNKEVLESWREVLTCGRYQSKLLHPTPAKIVAVRKYQANTNSTGFSSSSGGKYNSETLKSGYNSSTLSIQNIARAPNLSTEDMQKTAKIPKLDRLSTKTATSDGASAQLTTNTIIINQNKRDSDGEETAKRQARKKSVVKIEVVEEVGNGENLEEESSKNTTKKHTVRIEVVEEA